MKLYEKEIPKWAVLFLKTVCPSHLLEEIEGDIHQKYCHDLRLYSERMANRRLVANVLLFLRPGIFRRNKPYRHFDQPPMLKNHLITVFRLAQRQRLYAFINVLGLSVGLAATLLIAIYIMDELSYDKHIVDAARIYRVGISEIFKGEEIKYSDSGAPLAEAITKGISEIESAVRVSRFTNTLQLDDRSFIESHFLLADSNFFEFFGYKLVEGNPSDCLVGPNKLVISQSSAKKYFGYEGKGTESPVGKQIKVGMDGALSQITGVFADFPSNTHMKVNVILSSESSPYSKNDCWACYGFKTYFKTTHSANASAIQAKLDEFAQKQIIPRIEKDLGLSHEEFVKSGDRVSFFIQPLLKIHLESNIDNEFEPNGDILYVNTFGVVGIFLILIACINFMNLSTARALSRSKEVCVRKTMGATRVGLIPQFMLESLVYVFVAAILAIGIFYFTLIPFNTLSGKSLSHDLLLTPQVLIGGISVLFFVGLLAGSYPSFYLTSFNPASVLKSGSNAGSPKSFMRNSLVVVQYTISMALIISTLIVLKQVKFIQNKHLGFNKENILTISHVGLLGTEAKAFKDELLSHTEFVHASYTQAVPPHIESTFFVKPENSEQLLGTYFFNADFDLIETMGYEMKSGRYFSPDFPSDTSAVVINESCARLLGYDTHENKSIGIGNSDKWNVVGIVKDFNFASLKTSIQPLVIFLHGPQRILAVRLTAGDITTKVHLVESLWKKHSAGKAFEYSFIDAEFDALFRSEQNLGRVFATFTILAIFIACLGLFGLITYMAGKRMKEISIRKVLGANERQITILLLRDLIMLVFIAFFIAVPISWFGMEQWLQSFAYRVNFDLLSVFIAGVTGLLIAFLTVVYRSLKAAEVNPVNYLKND